MQSVKLDKEIFDKLVAKQDALKVFLHLLYQADDQGNIVTSICELGRTLNIERHAINRIIDFLIFENFLGKKMGNKVGSIIIFNIESYKHVTATKRATKRATKTVLVPVPSTIIADAIETFETRMSRDFPSVMKMQNPLTEDEYNKLVDKYSKEAVDNILDEMENYKDLCKKNKYASKTADKWLSMRATKGATRTSYFNENNLLLSQYPNVQGSYGAFLGYISLNFKNVWTLLPAPTEDDFQQIMIDTSKRGYLAEILKRMDGDPRNLQYNNFYTAFVKVFETILRYESTNTKLNRERAERHDALLRQQEESLRGGTEGQEPFFGNY